MTDRLYYADSYLARFDAHVVERSDDGRRIYLDRSAFYPTSGGQPHDHGTLGGIAVLDVVDEDDRVAHLLAAPLEGAEVDRAQAAGAQVDGAQVDGAQVEGVVEWGRRRDHMQQHTGQHLLSALAADRFGWETVSVHFGPDSSTLDLDAERISVDALREIERLANSLVTENLPVSVSFEDAARATGLRKPSERGGMLRVVSIADLDRSACGGTHVRATGEIGTIVLRRVERVRKSTRVEFLCGARALVRTRADYEIVSVLAQGLSCSIDELTTLVPSQHEQLRRLDNERRRLEDEVSVARARDAYAQLPPDSVGIRRLVERRASGKADAARALALAFCALPKATFVVAVSSPPSILFATSDDTGIDAGRALKAALGAVGGRGGGSPRLAQGTVPDAAALDAVVGVLAQSVPNEPS